MLGKNGRRTTAFMQRAFGLLLICIYLVDNTFAAMTLKQLQSSMDMMRSACAPKFKLSVETLDGLRKGVFVEDKELKCYTYCIAQMAGTITKKKEISAEKMLNQMDVMLPPDMKEPAKEAIMACKDVQFNYKDPCDRTYYSTKCIFDYNPPLFMFP